MADKSINRSIRIFVNGKEVEHSLNNVRKEMFRLQREVNGLERGTDEYVKKSAELRKVKAYFNEIRNEISGVPSLFDKLSKSASGLIAVFGLSFGIDAFISKFQRLIEMAAELSDWQSNVQKTTGMTRKEVQALTKDLDALNTRTSREDLLAIAEEGGRIGISKEEIAAFTKEMDKANVALGDTFGSASEVANVLGKLRFLYKETKEMGVSDAYNAIGSALNELGANGVASEQNIAAFATRVGALPNAFKPSIAEAMALGAAFEESGVDAEVASRSYGILVQTAAKNTKDFAMVMNTTQAEVERLINSNPVEFFLQFSKSLKGLDADGVKMAKALDALGVGADGVNKIIGAAANSNDRFRESILLSSQAMEEKTSLTNEFNTKNENLAATVEKIQKQFVEWATDEKVVEFIGDLVNWFGRLIGAVDDTGRETSTFIKILDFTVKVLAVALAATVSYNAAVRLSALFTKAAYQQSILYNIATKAATVAQNLQTIAVSVYSVIINTLRGNLYAAMRAQVALNTVMKLNPWGLALSAITAIIAAIIIFSDKTKEAAETQKKFSENLKEVHKAANESVASTTARISELITVIKSEAVSMETRKKAYEELIRINPIFNGFLVDEKFNIIGLTLAYQKYVEQLQNVARAKATHDLISKSYSDFTGNEAEIYANEKNLAILQKQLDILREKRKLGVKTEEGTFSQTEYYYYSNQSDHTKDVELSKRIKDTQSALNKLKSTRTILQQNVDDATGFFDNTIKKVERDIAHYNKMIKEFGETPYLLNELKKSQEELNALLGLQEESMSDTFEGKIPEKEKKGKSEWEKELDRRKRVAAEILRQEIENAKALLDAKRKAQDEEVELMEDGFLKELKRLDYEQSRRIEDLEIEIQERKKLQEKLKKDSQYEFSKGNISGGDALKKLANEQIAIINEKEATITSIEKTHLIKRRQLRFEYDKKDFAEKQKQHERELMNLETRQNEELKSISNFEKEKSKLSKDEQQKTINEIKSLLANQYGYSPEDLDKVKSFEKAKSEIILAQQKETVKKQLEILSQQQKDLKSLIDKEVAADLFGAGLLTTEELDELILKYEELANAISKLKNPEGVDENGRTEDQVSALSAVDILGTPADQWEEMFKNLDKLSNKLALAKSIATAMNQIWTQFFDNQNQKIQRDLQVFEASTNRKKTALAKQLEQGVISQETYNAKIAKLEADLERKRAEAEYKQSMNDWKAKMLDANVNTALAVVNALASGSYPANIVFAAIVGALGAVQIGMIAKNKPKKPQGYFSGGYTKGSGNYDEYGRELADGPVHADEYVTPSHLLKDPVIARMTEFIEARRRGLSPNLSRVDDGYADGGFTRAIPSGQTSPAENNSNSSELTAAIRDLTGILEYYQTNPMRSEISKNYQTAQELEKLLEEYLEHKNKNKR